MSIKETIEILTIHRTRLLETKTFEEYRDAHVAYIDMLIDQYKAEQKKQDAIDTFMKWQAVIKTAEDIAAVKTETVDGE